ncbi:ABC-2 type transport system permease protein [Rhodococcus sp. OK611]|uniref:ABC transporter permease n=1 Tax=Rhodococcus TaxID=1827 RepID=UPI000BD13E59|nr:MULTISPECIES: ABC transporter permease [Rhodococcus]MCZ4556252.1 ABC transporter permease [Rhodococcus maanshanensis]PTR36446.1 ABC-2 type transport system permease protein [Rhodococcus sp. OK611]SNX93933.1 ABC-2 type transport system permease protein [Rhodococcus sp. OK270]
MTTLAGTATLTRFGFRRERFALVLWALAGAVVYYSQAVGVDIAYPTQPELDAVAASMEGNAAMIAMAGPPRALDTIGGQVAFQASAFGMIVAGLMSMFVIGRHTRANEETGRDELIRSSVVGRHAPFAAAAIIATVANVLYGAVVALSLISYGLAAAGSIALGIGATCAGLVFAAVALLAAQITENTRTVYGITGAAIGAAYVLRAVGDVGSGALSWLSPLGWGQAMRPYDGEIWWPALLSLAVAVAVGLTALRVLDHRDVGAGVFPPRPGPARAPQGLLGEFGLAWRLQRGTLVGWSVGLFLGGVAFGTIGNDVGDLLGDVDIGELLGQESASMVDAFYAMAAAMLAMIGSAYTISSALRPRAEEAAGHLEPLLSTALTRIRWIAGHAVITLAGSALVLALAGLGMGLMYGIIADDMAQVPRMLGATLVYLPAAWVLGGLTLLLFGLLPRLASAAWIGLAFCFFVLMFGTTLKFPDRLMSVSPFENLPLVPAVDFRLEPLLVTTVVAGTLCLLGTAAFRRRDLQTN